MPVQTKLLQALVQIKAPKFMKDKDLQYVIDLHCLDTITNHVKLRCPANRVEWVGKAQVRDWSRHVAAMDRVNGNYPKLVIMRFPFSVPVTVFTLNDLAPELAAHVVAVDTSDVHHTNVVLRLPPGTEIPKAFQEYVHV